MQPSVSNDKLSRSVKTKTKLGIRWYFKWYVKLNHAPVTWVLCCLESVIGLSSNSGKKTGIHHLLILQHDHIINITKGVTQKLVWEIIPHPNIRINPIDNLLREYRSSKRKYVPIHKLFSNFRNSNSTKKLREQTFKF